VGHRACGDRDSRHRFALAFQWMAAITQGVWVTGHGIIVVLFYIVKFIGYSYSAASDPDSNFLLSFLGFTCGVGLCEEVTKALPVIVWLGKTRSSIGAPPASWGSPAASALVSLKESSTLAVTTTA